MGCLGIFWRNLRASDDVEACRRVSLRQKLSEHVWENLEVRRYCWAFSVEARQQARTEVAESSRLEAVSPRSDCKVLSSESPAVGTLDTFFCAVLRL